MKKLFMFVAVAALAFAGQAMQLDWKYDAAKADVGKTVYVLIGSTAQTEWESADAVAAAAANSGAIAKKGTKYNATGSFNNANITKTSADIYYVIVSADGTTFDVTSVSDMTGSVYDPNNQESTPGSNTSLSSASIAVSGKSFGGGGGGGGGGDGPEPTSGLLLLVGAGILGLRRKRA
jgi:hypothetical protein